MVPITSSSICSIDPRSLLLFDLLQLGPFDWPCSTKTARLNKNKKINQYKLNKLTTNLPPAFHHDILQLTWRKLPWIQAGTPQGCTRSELLFRGREILERWLLTALLRKPAVYCPQKNNQRNNVSNGHSLSFPIHSPPLSSSLSLSPSLPLSFSSYVFLSLCGSVFLSFCLSFFLSFFLSLSLSPFLSSFLLSCFLSIFGSFVLSFFRSFFLSFSLSLSLSLPPSLSLPLSFSPHLCVGFLFLILYPASSSSSASLSHTIFHTQLCHTPSFTHNFVTHHLSPHHLTHHFVTHHLSHTTLSHTIFHTQLCYPPSFTHNFVTHHHSHRTLLPTIFHTHLCHTPSFTHNFVTHHLPVAFGDIQPSFCVAGVAFGDIHLRFAWPLLHLVARLGPDWSPVTPRYFAWQAWHLATSTFICGTWRHPPSFCVAGVGLMALGWHWGALGLGLVAADAAALCVAGVALGDIHLCFTWQARHLETSTFVLRGRRWTYGTGLALVARLGWD